MRKISRLLFTAMSLFVLASGAMSASAFDPEADLTGETGTLPSDGETPAENEETLAESGAAASGVYTDLSEYTVTYSTDEDVLVVTNTLEKETLSVTGGITWDDAGNQDGTRPDSVTVQLYNGDTPISDKACTLPTGETASNKWTCTFTDLDKYENQGTVVDYNVRVISDAPSGYTYSFDKEADPYNTVASHTAAVSSQEVSVVFVDDDNRDGIRPTSVDVIMRQNGTEYGTSTEYFDANAWTSTFTDLPDYVEGSVGVAAAYTADLASSVTGYTASYNKDTGVLTLTHTVETRDVTVRKVWDDSSNNDGHRPASVCIVLKGDSADYSHTVTGSGDTWEYTFTDANKNLNGAAITYSIEETGVTCP